MIKRKLFSIFLALTTVSGCYGAPDKQEKKQDIVTLSWYYPGNMQQDQQMVEDAINEILVGELGVKVKLNPIKDTNYTQKISTMYRGGEEFDLCFTSDWTNNYYSCVSEGMFLPLNDLISDYEKKTKDNVPSYLLDTFDINGNIYAVPNYQVLYKQWSIALRKDLVEKYNFNVDAVSKSQGYKTVKEIEPFFDLIVENEPELYPMRQTVSLTNIYYESVGSGLIKKGDDNVKVVAQTDTPEWWANLELSREWYEKGYLNPDIFNVYAEESVEEYLKYAADYLVTKPGVEQEMYSKYGKEYILVPLCDPYLTYNSGMSAATAISSTSKHPKEAMKLIEYVNTDKEIYNLLCYGINGIHYEKISNKHIRVNPEHKYFPCTLWVFGNQMNSYLLENQPDDVWEITNKSNEEAQKSPIYGFRYDPYVTAGIKAQVSALTNEYDYLYIGDKERTTEYINKIKEAGINDIIENIQKQVDEFMDEK